MADPTDVIARVPFRATSQAISRGRPWRIVVDCDGNHSAFDVEQLADALNAIADGRLRVVPEPDDLLELELLHDFHESLEPFVPEDRHRPIGQWPMTADDVIGLGKLLEAKGLRLAALSTSDELERLREWKESAMAVLAEWDRVHEALGSPGPLGASKASCSLAEVERLRSEPDDTTRAEVEALVADHIHAGDVARSHDTPDLHADEQASLRRIVKFHDRSAELLAAAYLWRTD